MRFLGDDKTLHVHEWTTEAGLKARLVFTRCEFFCGYVGVPKEHAFHGVEPRYSNNDYLESEVANLEVHGGITFAQDFCPPNYEENAGLWWLGFDCNHCDDLRYEDRKQVQPPDYPWPMYFKDENYVMAECEKLARQIVDWKAAL